MDDNLNIQSRFLQKTVNFESLTTSEFLIIFETDLQTGLPIRSFFIELPDRYVRVRNFKMYLN